MNGIKNIIFDLGGVLLDIDFKRTEQAFADLGIANLNEMVTLYQGNSLFNALETGLDEEVFYNNFRLLTGVPLSNKNIQEAWCALLLGFRKKSIEKLATLKETHQIYLLSNTNEIHLKQVYDTFRSEFQQRELDDCFHAAYYSHRIQIRKPEAGAWLHIINKHSLIPAETVFIDDGAKNVEAAKELGLQAIQLMPGMYIEELDW
jgi:putative hydrolase of the HAD superfamily